MQGQNNLDRCPVCQSLVYWEHVGAHEQCMHCGYISSCCDPDGMAFTERDTINDRPIEHLEIRPAERK